MHYQKILNELAGKLIGDGGSPNIFFITEGVGANTLAVIIGTKAAQVIHMAHSYSGSKPIVVEDRQNGVVWENYASIRLQEKARIQEEGNDG